jgi:hypothetical protein
MKKLGQKVEERHVGDDVDRMIAAESPPTEYPSGNRT